MNKTDQRLVMLKFGLSNEQDGSMIGNGEIWFGGVCSVRFVGLTFGSWLETAAWLSN